MTVRPTLVLDFDGTLALGRGPLQAYVGALAAQLEDPARRDRVSSACLAAVAAFDAGTASHRDAYDAVRTAALAEGVADDQLGRAYLASRALLGTPEAPVLAPDGLAAFLAEISLSATCVLATNAPEIGVDRALRSLGIAETLTDRHHDLGKPSGLEPLVSGLLSHGPVLAVGDIWEFDLAPAHRLGADTALVGVRETPEARPTMRGASLSALVDPIRDWVSAQRLRTPA